MLDLGFIAFAQPWLLLALIGLPVLLWLLRLTPPAPRSQRFPAIRLLLGLRPPEETPARTPLWLLLLRALIVALIVLALAHPLANPSARLTGEGPVLLVIDDGWEAARGWEARRAKLAELLEQAAREGRGVIYATSAPGRNGEALPPSGLIDAQVGRDQLEEWHPKPWPSDRPGLLAALQGAALPDIDRVVWLADGLADERDTAFVQFLRGLAPVTVLRDPPDRLAHLLGEPEALPDRLEVEIRRAVKGKAEPLFVLARSEDGRLLGRAEARMGADATKARARFEMPIELRNSIARIEIEGERSVGATVLADEQWRRRPVGLAAADPRAAEPLLGELYYLERALTPFAELRRDSVANLLQRDLAVLVLADIGQLTPTLQEQVGAWVDEGGLLLRFAGPRLAQSVTTALVSTEPNALLPVTLRRGDRILGGSMTWDQPAALAPFHSSSPFAGLEVSDEVLVRRQVLAEPSLDLDEKTWARLVDGTPLVTAARRGQGWVVLVHTTANTEWSDLPISGLFVEMLRRIVQFSQGVSGKAAVGQILPPTAVLDAFGRLERPDAAVQALTIGPERAPRVSPANPPGYYGREGSQQALNLASAVDALRPLEALPASVTEADYTTSAERDLMPWLLAAALLLALFDMAIALAFRGLLPLLGRRAAAVLALAAGLYALPAAAQDSADARAIEATLDTRLAYVLTGVPSVDETSAAGLGGLTRVLFRRTAVEPGDPVGVQLGYDELAFYPLLYWPVTPEQRDLDGSAVRAVQAYMRNGGTILLDLREQQSGGVLFGRNSRATQALQRLTQGLDIPPLQPVSPDHVLTKSFYLLQDFPGRFSGGGLWIEAAEETVNDGVASIIVGANDWAAAWAVDEFGRPLFATVPGGERQREFAYRFGVNLVMYALTGNYKADQVHVPFILERLGQ